MSNDGHRAPDRRESPITTLDEVRAPHNVVAAYRDVRTARKVIAGLEAAEISPETISLLGASTDDPGPPTEPAGGAPGEVGKHVVGGGAVGAVAGGIVGGLSTFFIPGVGTVVGAGLGALLGSGVGSVIGGVQSLESSEAWLHTFEHVKEGNVCVGVHSDDPEEVEKGREVLQRYDPMSVRLFDES